MPKILPKYIVQVKWSAFVRRAAKLVKEKAVNDPNLRILKITSRGPIKTLTDSLRNNKEIVKKLLVSSSHLFFLIVETVYDDIDLVAVEHVLIDILNNSKKPFLFEICQCSGKFVRYIFRNDTLERLPDDTFYGWFQTQCAGESFVQFDFTVSTNLLKNVQWQWEPIAIRLMRTIDVPCDESFDRAILKTFVLQSNLHALRAYLDLPLVDDGSSVLHTVFTTKAVNFKYENDETLLFFAAKGDYDLLKLLLRLGADVQVENTDCRTASDNAKSNENLKLLIENDARFPLKFYEKYNNLFKNATDSIVKRDIRKICRDREEFHAAIKAKDISKIKSFKDRFPHLQFAYAFSEEPRYSQAATTTALQSAIVDENYTTYFLLLDNGFRLNEADLDYMDIRNANKGKINALTLSRLKRDQPSHITFLLAVTKLYGVRTNQHEKCMKQMHTIYNELNKFRKVTSLLRLLQHSKSLVISVDFRNRKTGTMDLNGICKGMDGVTYHELGRIYVSAGGKTNDEIAGFLIHELTHYVLHIVFNNACKPYYKSDENGKSTFDGIIQNTKKGPIDRHVVIKNVFRAYPKIWWPKELIVTIPQLIALKVDENEMERKYDGLFKFYANNILPIVDMLTIYPEEFMIKREVQQLNEFLGHSQAIDTWNVWPLKRKLSPELFRGKDIQLVVCETPRLFLADLYNSIVKPMLISSPNSRKDDGNLMKCFIVSSIGDFKCASKAAYIKRIWHLTSDIQLILNCDQFDESDQTFAHKYFNHFDTSRNLIAFGRNESVLRKQFVTKCETLRFEYAWSDVEACSRARLLDTRIHFQGVCIQLNELIDDTFSDIPLKKLVNGETIVIEASKVSVDNYDDDKFVERSFTQYRNLDKVLSVTSNGKFSILLSGEAGTGKSTMLSRITLELKHKYPLFWVTRINLHEHIDAFQDESINVLDPQESAFNYFVKTIDDAQRNFERKLFEKLFADAKVILLLDAVDEVAPTFIEPVSTFIERLSEKIQLWITTRPHLTDDLDATLQDKILKLEFNPFTRSDQLKCATKYWRKELHLFGAMFESKLAECAENIMSLFSESINEFVWKPTVGAPLLTSMIAETYLKYVQEYVTGNEEKFVLPQYLDIFDLFKEFVAKKLLIVNNEKGILVANEKVQNEIFSHDTIAVFERFALRFIFQRKISSEKLYVYHDAHFFDKTLMIDGHNIQRSGLVVLSSNDKRPYFIHKTFAEFFVANFIVKSLKNASYVSGDPANRIFTLAMDILCKNIIFIEQEHFTLMKFIDGGMKYLWNDENWDAVIFRGSQYFSDIDNGPKVFHFKFDNLDYVLKENAIVLLQFFLETLTDRYNDTESRKRFFLKCSIFWEASRSSVRCVLEHLWLNTPLEIFMTHFRDQKSRTFTVLQLAFMNFPECNIDIVRDITNFGELRDALSKKAVFDELLQKSTVEKYNESTLKGLVDIALHPVNGLTDDEKHLLIYDYVMPDLNFDYNISEEHFDYFIEAKWMAMTELGFPVDDWSQLVNGTIFENVILFICNEFNCKIILKLYKWAKGKVNDSAVFKGFIAQTFLKYFWNCMSENGVSEMFEFIRSEVNLKDALQHQAISGILLIPEEHSVELSQNFPICEKYFAKDEFEMLLLNRLENGGVSIISNLFNCGNRHILETIWLTLFPLSEDPEFAMKIRSEVGSHELCTVLRSVLGSSLCNTLSVGHILNCIQNVADVIHLRAALLSTSDDNETLFHIAAKRRDLAKIKLLWNFARPILTTDELEQLLVGQNEDATDKVCASTRRLLFHRTQDDASKGYLNDPPSILNTECRTAAFEFVPFEFGGSIPELAIRINDTNVKSVSYLGRYFHSNGNDYGMCKIMPKSTEVEAIGLHDELGKKVTGYTFEIMVGKGLRWKSSEEEFQNVFKFRDLALIKKADEDVSLVGVAPREALFLVYDDDASSGETNNESGLIYCHQSTMPNDILY